MRSTQLSHAWAVAEYSILWCCWMVFGFFAGYTPGWRAGYVLVQSFEMQKYFEELPYERIWAMAKIHRESGKVFFPYTQEEVQFYAFIISPNLRQGLRALIIGGLLSISRGFWVNWLDRLVQYPDAVGEFLFGAMYNGFMGSFLFTVAILCIFGVILFGFVRVIQGCLDIL